MVDDEGPFHFSPEAEFTSPLCVHVTLATGTEVKFIRSFLKLSFLISLFKRFPLQFTSRDITFFFRFFCTERCHLFLSFALFLNKIVKPMHKTPFS